MDQLTGRGREDVAALAPEICCRLPLAFLFGRVVAQQRHQFVLETDPAPPGPRLGVPGVLAQGAVLRALAGLLSAARPAAAVRSLRPQPVAVDDERPGVEIDVRPRQPERFPLPQPERQRDGPPRAVASRPGGGGGSRGCRSPCRAPPPFLDLWGTGDGGDVLRDVLPPHRLVQCGADGVVHLVGASARRARCTIARWSRSRCSGSDVVSLWPPSAGTRWTRKAFE